MIKNPEMPKNRSTPAQPHGNTCAWNNTAAATAHPRTESKPAKRLGNEDGYSFSAARFASSVRAAFALADNSCFWFGLSSAIVRPKSGTSKIGS